MALALAPASVLTVGPPSSVTTTCTSAASIAILMSMFFVWPALNGIGCETKGREAGIAGLDHVASRGEPANRIAAGGIGGCGAQLLAVRCSHGHLRAGNQRAGGVENVAVKNAGRRPEQEPDWPVKSGGKI